MHCQIVERIKTDYSHKFVEPFCRTLVRRIGGRVHRRSDDFRTKFVGESLQFRPFLGGLLRSHVGLVDEVRLVESEYVFCLRIFVEVIAYGRGVVAAVPGHGAELHVLVVRHFVGIWLRSPVVEPADTGRERFELGSELECAFADTAFGAAGVGHRSYEKQPEGDCYEFSIHLGIPFILR